MNGSQNRKMSTCNRLDLESLGSWPTMPKNFPGTDVGLHGGRWGDSTSRSWKLSTFVKKSLELARKPQYYVGFSLDSDCDMIRVQHWNWMFGFWGKNCWSLFDIWWSLKSRISTHFDLRGDILDTAELVLEWNLNRSSCVLIHALDKSRLWDVRLRF